MKAKSHALNTWKIVSPASYFGSLLIVLRFLSWPVNRESPLVQPPQVVTSGNYEIIAGSHDTSDSLKGDGAFTTEFSEEISLLVGSAQHDCLNNPL